jgi:hypothetical protein
MNRDSRTTSRPARELRLVAEARRLVGMERHYCCPACSHEHTSWLRLRSCPDCGERLTVAVIHRAALTRTT